MATTTIISGCVYVTTGSVSGDTITHADNGCVEIFSNQIEYDLQNEVGNNPIAVSPKKIGSKEPLTLISDLKRIKIAVSVTGGLNDDADRTNAGGSNEEAASIKRNNLISFLKNEKSLVVVWGLDGSHRIIFGNTSTDKAVINKVKFTETAGHLGDALTSNPPPFRKLLVNIQFIIGKSLGG